MIFNFEAKNITGWLRGHGLKDSNLDTTAVRRPFWLCGCQTSDEEAEGVQWAEADEFTGQVVDARPLTDDQEDATIPERTEPLLNPSTLGWGLYEEIPGTNWQALQGGTGKMVSASI